MASAEEAGEDFDQLAAQIQVERHGQGIDELGIPRFRITNGPVGVGMGDGTPSSMIRVRHCSKGLPTGTVMGHVHLKVADIRDTIAFYRDVLGFELMAQLGRQAAFLAAGGYHHHIGANTWESSGAAPPPPGTAALRQATVVLPDSGERDAVLERLERHGHDPQGSAGAPIVRDPSGNRQLLAIA